MRFPSRGSSEMIKHGECLSSKLARYINAKTLAYPWMYHICECLCARLSDICVSEICVSVQCFVISDSCSALVQALWTFFLSKNLWSPGISFFMWDT